MSKFKECWVVVRDEFFDPYDVIGYSEVADLGKVKLCYAMWVDDERPEKEELFEEWIKEEAEWFGTEFHVFPSSDCYKTREEAKKALEELQANSRKLVK